MKNNFLIEIPNAPGRTGPISLQAPHRGSGIRSTTTESLSPVSPSRKMPRTFPKKAPT
mgnify:CR=1 FL=1